jgi:hypothetical protein
VNISETKVKELVAKWLGERGYQFVRSEFLLEGRRIDFVAARWTDDGHQLDIVGVECKGQITAIALSTIVAEQVTHFARNVPVIYLACSMPREEKLQDIMTFCRVASIGFLGVAEHVGDPTEPGTINPHLDWVRYMHDVRSRVVMFLEFEKKFGERFGSILGGRTDWISINRPQNQPQWNATIHPRDSHCFLGVNVENANRLFRVAAIDGLADCMARLPSAARCEIWRVRFLGRSQRVWLPVRRAPAQMVADELGWLSNLTRVLDAGESLAYTVGFPLWARDEVMSQHVHTERLDTAHEVLSPLYKMVDNILSSDASAIRFPDRLRRS